VLQESIDKLALLVVAQNSTITQLSSALGSKADSDALQGVQADLRRVGNAVDALPEIPAMSGTAACNPAESCLKLHRGGCVVDGVYWLRPFGANGGIPCVCGAPFSPLSFPSIWASIQQSCEISHDCCLPTLLCSALMTPEDRWTVARAWCSTPKISPSSTCLFIRSLSQALPPLG